MYGKATISKSLTQQILDKMFKSLESQEEFNDKIIQKLKRLADRGDLKKKEKITTAIKSI
jgi:hypothetical protein